MYLSRLILDPRGRAARRDLADCQALHRTLLSVFPPLPAPDRGPREHFGLLYRVDTDPRAAGATVLVQSRLQPPWHRLPPGYLLDTRGARDNPACKRVDQHYAALREGMRLIFRLRANPTRKVDTRSAPDGARRHGRRVKLCTEPEQLAWLQRKGEQCGFRLTTTSPGSAVPNVRAIDEASTTGKTLSRQATDADGPDRLTFGSVLFQGELVVTDADALRRALAAGIGSGKAYGFGLLSIAAAGR